MTMGQTPPKGLVMAKRQATPRTCVIWHGMWYCVIWNQSWNNYGNPLANLSGENSFKGVQTPSLKGLMHINVTCIRMPSWKNKMKVWGLGLVCSFSKKKKGSHLI
jgi:hypothetical protein